MRYRKEAMRGQIRRYRRTAKPMFAEDVARKEVGLVFSKLPEFESLLRSALKSIRDGDDEEAEHLLEVTKTFWEAYQELEAFHEFTLIGR